MMAAYQPQPGAMHPGMAPHAHPAMTPGQPMNPAQMQQMGHPGAVTPGPHVTQAGAMMAMQPGVGPAGMSAQHPGGQMGGMPGQMGGQSMAGGIPNAHALSHLTPQAAMQQQQMMQQHLQANPQLAMQQQAMMQRRMAAMQNGAMGPGMQQNAMQGMTPQQLQQLQNSQAMGHPQGVQLPQHLLQRQMQVQMQQQQQAAQNQQMQHQIAMQQANSQQSNQSAQAAPQNPQGGQQQHPGQPMRPQSRMANPNEQSQGGPPQNAQQAAQQGQPQQTQQQAPQQQAQQAQQGQPNQQQGQPQGQGQQGQQPQQMTTQQLQVMQQRQRQIAIQQQNAIQARMQQAQQAQQVQQQQSQGGAFILRAILFADQLSVFDSQTGQDITQWHAFVDRHFAPEGRFMHSFSHESTRRFEVPRPTIPRYFQMYFDSNASSIQLHLEHIREVPVQPGRHQVSFSNATFTVLYPNGARLEMHGSVKMLFAPGSDLIELMELHTANSEEHVSRSEIERILSNWSPTMANKPSPKMTKKNLPKAQQKLQSQFEGLSIEHFPRTPISQLGTTDRVQAFLELNEPMNLMADLIAFAQEKKMRPEQALDALVAEYDARGGLGGQPNQQGNPQINLPPNGVPAGNRTPSMQNMQMPNAQPGQFSSPSVSNLNLPMQNGMPGMNGSPHIANNSGLAPNMNMANSHTPSPHQSNMAAPPMVPQHSQQGTNSSAASANTSPNVNNKRRRSTVKLEGDEGGDGSQGGRVKPSPRMPKKSKPGGA